MDSLEIEYVCLIFIIDILVIMVVMKSFVEKKGAMSVMHSCTLSEIAPDNNTLRMTGGHRGKRQMAMIPRTMAVPPIQ